MLLPWIMLFAAADPYAALRMYDGTWKAQNGDQLVDQCALVGTYFVCQQTVNGKVGALLVFVPKGTPGDFYTQNILPEGWATGRGELHIDGNRWTYSSKSEKDGKVTYHRTVNTFTGTDAIHSESAESTDGEHWTVTPTGDLVRVKAGS
jgi:hypothetical protein